MIFDTNSNGVVLRTPRNSAYDTIRTLMVILIQQTVTTDLHLFWPTLTWHVTCFVPRIDVQSSRLVFLPLNHLQNPSLILSVPQTNPTFAPLNSSNPPLPILSLSLSNTSDLQEGDSDSSKVSRGKIYQYHSSANLYAHQTHPVDQDEPPKHRTSR